LQTTALDIEHGKIAAIYVVRNPDNLRHLHEAAAAHRLHLGPIAALQHPSQSGVQDRIRVGPATVMVDHPAQR